LDLADSTLVMFSSDNGPHNEANHNPKRFTPAGPLRGMKRDLYDGGIRVPMIAWWPGKIQAGGVSDHIGYFGDLMATAVDLAGVAPPMPNDSISFLPTLVGQPDKQKQHEYLYWEFYERGGARAIRTGPWKGVRPKWHAPMELYDVTEDPGEQDDVASEHPDVVQKIAQMMDDAHQDIPLWTTPPKR
jgi:uncharacterized sulfatase